MKLFRSLIVLVLLPIFWLYVTLIVAFSTTHFMFLYLRMFTFYSRIGMVQLMPSFWVVRNVKYRWKYGMALVTNDCLSYALGEISFKRIFVA